LEDGAAGLDIEDDRVVGEMSLAHPHSRRSRHQSRRPAMHRPGLSEMNYDQPVALVTGANQDIGLQIEKDVAGHGFTVLVGSRNHERGEVAASEVGSNAHVLQLDVTDAASIGAAAKRVREEFGRLDVLIQNAAISNTNKLAGQPLEGYAATTRSDNVSLDEMRAV
jgi:NAD(P)-dependent dehydrogenase (short-subunit alcohol dehydrogenase family)